MKIRTLLTNNDPTTRARIRSLLDGEPDIAVVGDCTSDECVSIIDEATLICAGAPMPHVGDVLPRITSGVAALIFTADSERYAVHAFEVGAADYVVEPFTDERFALALTRARTRLSGAQPSPSLSPTGVSDPSVRSRDSSGMVVFKSSGRVHLLHDTEIHWCEAVGNYVRIHADAGPYLVRSTLAHLEKQLHAARFVRVHRSTIVNVGVIRELRATNNGDYTMTLRDNTALTLSRGYRDAFERVIGHLL